MVPLESFEGVADRACKMLVKDGMYEKEDDVSSNGGAVKAVGNGSIDGRPSVSRPVLMIWRLHQFFTGKGPNGDRLTPTVPGTLSGATVVGGN